MRSILPQGLAVAALLALCQPAPAQAPDAVLALVPADAPLVFQINGFGRAKERLGKMIGNALPDLAPKALKHLDDALAALLDGRDPKGIAKEGHILNVVTDLDSLEDEPELAVVVPVTSYQDFVAGFLKEEERKGLKKEDGYDAVKVGMADEPMCLIDRKTHVIVAKNPAVARLFLMKQGGLDKALSPATRTAFLSPDVAIYANVKLLHAKYGPTLNGLKTTIEGLLQLGADLDEKEKAQIKDALQGMLQVFEDGITAVAALQFRPEGLNLRVQAEFGDKTQTGKFLQTIKPSPLVELNALPPGQMGYSAMRLDPKLSKAVSGLLAHIGADDTDADAKVAINDAAQELVDAGLEAQFSSSNLPAANIETAVYKDPLKAVAAQLKILKALTNTGTIQNVPLKEKPQVKENAETVGAFKFHHATIALDLDKATESVPGEGKEALKGFLERMVGKDLNLWFGTDGKTVLEVRAKDWKSAKGLIDGYLNGGQALAKDEAFQLVRKNLPGEATLLSLLDAVRTTSEMYQFMREMLQGFAGVIPGLPAEFPELPKPEGKPAYVGFAIVLRPEHGSFELFIPGTTAQQMRKLLAPLLEKVD